MVTDISYSERVEQRANVSRIAQGHRNVVAKALRSALRGRSGRAWSVTCGRGTAWGWIHIRTSGEDEARQLARLLGLDYVHHQGYDVPSSMAYRRVALARALYGDDLGFTAAPYWD